MSFQIERQWNGSMGQVGALTDKVVYWSTQINFQSSSY